MQKRSVAGARLACPYSPVLRRRPRRYRHPWYRQVGAAQWYRFLHATASQLAGVPAAEMALQLFLACAASASEEAGLEVQAYEFFEQVGGRGGGAASVREAPRRSEGPARPPARPPRRGMPATRRTRPHVFDASSLAPRPRPPSHISGLPPSRP